MGMMNIRSIPDEVHNALKARAKQNHRSAEDEVRAILEEATRPECRLKMGDALTDLSRKVGVANEDVAIFEQVQGKTPAEPMRFE
ncbi:plasmid stabilization protein [Vreelandella alkaliphila]|uniref:FitA-like ribbon-helix-helix domain-containing protein n=1 Tax=Vreelandella alkaliphila TaxID=272774 RepID=UPI000EA37A39|nr:Arc family DNA-binding protein [Halomonas alkaliphila]AYF32698.1 plasmid stabilization protein [Halomonas alkaliphila]